MADYKHTLNLPTTSFPMKANLAGREPERLKAWQEQSLYEKIRLMSQDKPSFILHDGPPYANGHLHCGHALNKILKDIIIKSKTFSGMNAPFIPGWDCHGLPIELNVEKKVGKAGNKISAQDFRAKCREYAASQIEIQREEFKRLGVFGDWEKPYATFDYHYEANIIRALGKIIENGHLEQGFKPVHWCIACGSALAEAEVDYENKTSDSIDVAFFAEDPAALLALFSPTLPIKPVIVPIWTTTPWSLPGNEAVCLHPNLDYTLINAGERYFILATSLIDANIARWGIQSYQCLGQIKGQQFTQLRVFHPFEERPVPIITGEHVTTEAGTGCVHTAPAHGPDDYLVGKAFNLPLINPVLGNGCYAPSVPHFANRPVLKVNDDIIDLLKKRQVLLHHETIQHSYPHCWRHKTPMIFLATPQWFISMDKNGLRAHIMKVIGKVNWVPDWGKSRIANMVESRPDWCISRQRAWGTPMPLFVHKVSRELHPHSIALLEKVASRVEKEGIESWFASDVSDWLDEEDTLHFDKITDTLDVWFDSGVSHFSVLKQNSELHLPADIYFEGSDQHRGWFNSSLTTAVAMYGDAPYKTVLTHGYTVDSEGKKLSKSKGNYIALDKVIEQHGADILRLWVSSTDYRNEVSISEEILKRNGDAYRRIRNTARFLLANTDDFTPEIHLLAPNQLVELDKWIIQQAQQLQSEILIAYEHYHFHLIYQKIHNFCAVDLGSFYLDVIKDRQYTTPKDSIARRSCQTAMYHILHALTRWLAPILSFTAEEIWQATPWRTSDSIFLERWYIDWPRIDGVDKAFWEKLQTVREEVNKALEVERQQGHIGSALAAEVILYADDDLLPLLAQLNNELRFLLITSSALIKPLNDVPDSLAINQELGLAIEIKASQFEKCARCWHRTDDIGEYKAYSDLCGRCARNLMERYEVRNFA